MIQSKTFLIFIILFIAGICSSCIDNEYDLSDVSTDDIAVGGSLSAPFGSIRWTTGNLFKLGDKPEIEVSLKDTIKSSFPVQVDLDQDLLDKLTENGELRMNCSIINRLPVDMYCYLDFIIPTENNETTVSLFVHEKIGKGEIKGIVTTFKSRMITQEELQLLRQAKTVEVMFVSSKKNQQIRITQELLNSETKVTLTLSKTGGISLN